MLEFTENPDVVNATNSGALERHLREQYHERARRKKIAVVRHHHVVRQRSILPLLLARGLANPAVPEPEIKPIEMVYFLLCLAIVGGWNGAFSATSTIKREICTKYKITVQELQSNRRSANVVQPRHEAFWRMRRETSFSFPDIGRMFGGFDHTSVLHGAANYEKIQALAKAGIPQPGVGGWDLSKMILGAGNSNTETTTKNEGK